MRIVMTCVLTFAALIQALVQAHAQTMPAREAFEKYGLLGTYTIDCGQPVSAANGYIVYRAYDATRVQRDTMTSPTDRMFVSIAETVTLSGLNQLTITGLAGNKPLSYTLQIEGPRQRVMQWSEDGQPSVINGEWLGHNYTMPWVTRCP